MSQSTPNGPPMFGIKYALLKRRPMYTYRGDITLRETGHHAGLFYAVVSNGLTNVGRLVSTPKKNWEWHTRILLVCTVYIEDYSYVFFFVLIFFLYI